MPRLLTKQYFCKCVYLECTRKIVLFHIIFGDCNKYIVTKSNFIEGKKKWPQLPNSLWSQKMTWVREIHLSHNQAHDERFAKIPLSNNLLCLATKKIGSLHECTYYMYAYGERTS